MKLSTHASRIIPAAAAVAVALAALAATFAAMQGTEAAPAPASPRVQGPPPELLTVRVVKAPPIEPAPQLARTSHATGD